MLQAINQTRRTILCARLDDAGGLGGQTRGLLGRAGIDTDQGLLFIRNRFEPFMWMHMFFMRFEIDIVFLDRRDRVVHISHQLKPWRMSPILFKARKALELAAGAAARSATTVGDEIRIADAPLAN
ncbi:MAG: DUF192 domain-containing protein [Candidatus Binataceae bacterium]